MKSRGAKKRNVERCSYCQRPMVKPKANGHQLAQPHHPRMRTNDHVFPASKGGTRTVPACARCNQLKGDMLPEEWAQYMADHPRWWA